MLKTIFLLYFAKKLIKQRQMSNAFEYSKNFAVNIMLYARLQKKLSETSSILLIKVNNKRMLKISFSKKTLITFLPQKNE